MSTIFQYYKFDLNEYWYRVICIMKVEYGKYYLIKTDKFYFCPALHRKVKFGGNVAIKCGSEFGNGHYFGSLVDNSNPHGPDYDTNNDIEFSDDDIISEYQLKDMPLFYMDFPNITK